VRVRGPPLLLCVLLALPTVGLAATASTPAFTTHPAPPGWAESAGEPSLGVDPATDAALFQAYTRTYRVTFDASGAATWSDVTPPHALGTNLDPMLFTDPGTGQTFAGGLEGECSVFWSTTDEGASWTPVGNACAPPAVDHETIFAGPAHAPLTGRMVYYCAHAEVETCSASPDGGLTFGPSVPIGAGTHPCLGTFGHGRVGPEGTAYVPAAHCQIGAGVMVSATDGLSWTTTILPASLPPPAGFDPAVATTRGGWVYAAFQDAKGREMVTLSKDQGAHWTFPRDAAAGLGLATTTFNALVAGDDERAAVAFLGTTTPGDAFAAGFPGAWSLYVSFTYDGGQTWTAVQASDGPVQRGWICADGLTCSGGRNLLDFIDAAMDGHGRVLVAYADGCEGCADPSGSHHAKGTIARQSGGLGLLAAFDG